MALSVFLDALYDCPVVASVKDEAGLERALASQCRVVFLLFGERAQHRRSGGPGEGGRQAGPGPPGPGGGTGPAGCIGGFPGPGHPGRRG